MVPARVAWLEALSIGDDTFTDRFGIAVAPGWVGFPEALPHALDGARREPESAWGTQLFFDEGNDGALVGFGGFKGPPRDGEVELGYAVAPSRQGRGIATAVVTVLVERARAAGVITVSAHTLAEENPSTAVLRKNGFIRTAALDDPDAGAIWRWELPVSTDSMALTLRPAQPNDLRRVRDLLLLAYQRYAADLPAELFERYMADLPPDADDLMRTVVVEAGGQLIGTARLCPPGTAQVPLPADAAWVRAVAVHPEAEGAGIARRLMAWCEHQARQLGAARLMLHTADFMARAVQLYDGIGYRRAPQWDADAHYSTGKPTGVIAYELDLDPADDLTTADRPGEPHRRHRP